MRSLAPRVWRIDRDDHALKLFVEFATRAGYKNTTGNAALAVLYSLHNARGLAALGTISALRCIHYFLAVCSLCDLCHVSPSVSGISRFVHYRADLSLAVRGRGNQL